MKSLPCGRSKSNRVDLCFVYHLRIARINRHNFAGMQFDNNIGFDLVDDFVISSNPDEFISGIAPCQSGGGNNKKQK